ncbi:hypothetical protein O3G_MSEX012866 [Manduca sexta]|uniref:Uncharacterized protein n=1 Tax=Manduca sexta TaxID=7130 RepID=A0A921ZPP5_MANSE|nr:hypothetical protein O3G_MSEX012866 [Manduca sexta]
MWRRARWVARRWGCRCPGSPSTACCSKTGASSPPTPVRNLLLITITGSTHRAVCRECDSTAARR